MGSPKTWGGNERTTRPCGSRICVTSRGCISVPPLAIAEATKAICIGLARSLSRPIAEYASRGSFCVKYEGIGKRPVWNGMTNGMVGVMQPVWAGGSVGQNPYACACADKASAPSFSPISAKVTLHDSRKASAMVTRDAPPKHDSLPKFWRGLTVWGMDNW